MGLLLQFAGRLRAVVAQLHQQRAALDKAAGELAAARDRLTQTTGDSANEHLLSSLAAHNAALSRIRRANRLINLAAGKITEYSRVIGLPYPLPDADPADRDQPPATIKPTVPVFVDHIAHELKALLPRGTKAVGVLTTSDGATRSAPIWSGVDGPGRGGPGLRTDDPQMPWNQIASALHHVEGHVAAIMRRPGGPRHATLIVSRPPCPGPNGCHELLPDLLPAGATLTVYALGKDGKPTWFNTYNGTGRGTTT